MSGRDAEEQLVGGKYRDEQYNPPRESTTDSTQPNPIRNLAEQDGDIGKRMPERNERVDQRRRAKTKS
jgi:hypothetical protein